MTSTAQIAAVTPDTVPLLQSALERLSADLGDPHRMAADTLSAALFGPHPACHAVLATEARTTVLGAALFSPVASTSTGAAGVYVSDLWVSEPARGRAIGQDLLAHVAGRARLLWQARFFRLVSYAQNRRALVFYNRLGFVEKSGDLILQLSGDAFDQLSG